jgi:hypothetical protein
MEPVKITDVVGNKNCPLTDGVFQLLGIGLPPSNSRSLSWRDVERTGGKQWRARQMVSPTAVAQKREHLCDWPESYAGRGGCGKRDVILSRAEGLAVVVTNGFLLDRAVRCPGLPLGLGTGRGLA